MDSVVEHLIYYENAERRLGANAVPLEEQEVLVASTAYPLLDYRNPIRNKMG